MIRQFSNGVLGSGDFVSEQDEVAQDIKSRLHLIRGEYYRDLNAGMPWFDALEKPTNLSRIEGEIKSIVLNTSNVVSVVSYESSTENRHLTIAMSIATAFGTLQFEESF